MATQNELRKYLNYEFSSGPYTGTDYKTFERKYINYLKKMCAHYGWTVEKVSKNHYEFSCFIKNVNGHFVYLAIPDVRHFPGVGDSAISKTGKMHYYYTCKGKKRSVCQKKRENKNSLELIVMTGVKKCLQDPKKAEFIVDGVLSYHDKRTSNTEFKSLETRIAKANLEVDELTNTFISAKNDTLRSRIEVKMNELEIYLKDLVKQKVQLEHERGVRLTKSDLLDFISELISGDENDKAYQKRLIDNLIYTILVFDGKVRTFLNLKGGGEIAELSFDDMQNAQLVDINEAIPSAENSNKTKATQPEPDGVRFRSRLAGRWKTSSNYCHNTYS